MALNATRTPGAVTGFGTFVLLVYARQPFAWNVPVSGAMLGFRLGLRHSSGNGTRFRYRVLSLDGGAAVRSLGYTGFLEQAVIIRCESIP